MWSDALTTPLAAVVPPGWRGAALATVKAVHTAIFASVGAMIVLLLWDGISGRPGRRAIVAGTVVLAESAIYASNDQVCPLTPLAEQLGAGSGAVADIFLPDWFSRRIPLIGGSAFALGVLLNVLAWSRNRPKLLAGEAGRHSSFTSRARSMDAHIEAR
jgi:hypothetical protein